MLPAPTRDTVRPKERCSTPLSISPQVEPRSTPAPSRPLPQFESEVQESGRQDWDLTVPAEGFTSSRVRVHDHSTGEHAWCEVTGRPTPAGPQRNCFATKKGELWTLELRLEHNGAKIGQLVADLSKPSIASLWDVKVCDVINYDTTRFRGVGTALVAHLVHGSWKDGQHPKACRLLAEDVDETALFFWYSLGFRITSDAYEGELIDAHDSLNAKLQSAVEECLTERPQCVKAAAMPGGTHDMSLDLRCLWS